MSFVIEQALSQWVLEKRNQSHPKTLVDAAEYALMTGGKRIRPTLMIASAQALGISTERVLPLAIATEIYHTFSLVHDDLPGMDNDDLRRGQPTVHRQFGDAQAILVGDYLLHESMTLFYRSTDSDGLRSLFEQSTGGIGVIGGQSVEFEETIHPGQHTRTWIHDQKTAALFRLSVAAPAYLATHVTAQYLEPLKKLGTDLGLAFQIADDLEDQTGNTRKDTALKITHKKKLEEYDQWFRTSSWPGNTEQLRLACRQIANKLDSA